MIINHSTFNCPKRILLTMINFSHAKMKLIDEVGIHLHFRFFSH